ncbi:MULTISPECIES: alpha/beta hydrolase [unclassified Dietzia]|uniref:alpha/beta hydrolase n=1 Tax=unclassified Dietzia TaxID=2617939 RepID=UPI0015FB92A3|nr:MULTISPECIES: alpha/beta hydrolase family protein [unclassified Dietzia]MBB1024590.1 esterase family protein [Dietzia sp. DQ12-76]MBB1027035.1 esterase family protein [Dietzia sp. DQ11-38-2]
MPLGLHRVVATAGAFAVALTLGSATPVLAQTASIDPSTLGSESLGTILEAAGSVPVGSATRFIGSVGSADFPLDGEGSATPLPNAPRPVDETITTSEFVEVERTSGEYEYWLVTSAAMKREVILEVVPSRITDDGPAPVLYMLDGVDAPEYNSGWNHQARIHDRVREDNVHVVIPTGAYASYYADWNRADPVLGYNKWETFLTRELPGIVEQGLATKGLETNGKSAIGGASMGGQAAMHLAATYPEIYRGVMSFSGYYSTMDALGYQSVRGTIETRGGDVENMWGPRRSEQWKRHDTVSHAGDLRNTAVYFSSGSNVAGPADLEYYRGGADALSMIVGQVLEMGVLEGSKALEKALDRAGVGYRVDYSDTGFHNWPNFLKNFGAGWDHIKPALES